MAAAGTVVGCLQRAAELSATPYPPHQVVDGGVGLRLGEIHQCKLLFGINSDSHVFCVFMSINNHPSIPPERQVDFGLSTSRFWIIGKAIQSDWVVSPAITVVATV